MFIQQTKKFQSSSSLHHTQRESFKILNIQISRTTQITGTPTAVGLINFNAVISFASLPYPIRLGPFPSRVVFIKTHPRYPPPPTMVSLSALNGPEHDRFRALSEFLLNMRACIQFARVLYFAYLVFFWPIAFFWRY